MRQVRPEAFDPKYKQKKIDEIDLSGIVPIKREAVFSSTPPQSPTLDTPSQNRTVEPPDRTVRSNRTVEPFDDSDSNSQSVLHELDSGVVESPKRKTQRYSFEIYSDQKENIEELQYHYKKRTGKIVSASRIIREALDKFLTEAIKKVA